MTILSAQFANSAGTAVTLITQEAGSVLLDLSAESDASGGWREIYLAWTGETSAFIDASPTTSMEKFAESQGYSAFDLLNLSDVERDLQVQGIPLPPKSAAVRQWVNDVRAAFITQQQPPVAPYSLSEVMTELSSILIP